MGRVTRAVIHGMALQVFRDRKLYLDLRSREAVLDLQKQTAEFRNALLVGRQGDLQLLAPQLFWNERDKHFQIPADYQLITPQGQLQGKGALIDADLKLVPLPNGKPPHREP